MQVLVTSNSFGKYSSKPKEMLEKAGFKIVFNPYHRMMTECEFKAAIKDADAVILSTEVLNQSVIDSAAKLKVVSRYGVGLDNVDLAYCKEKSIRVTTTKNANSNAVAEFAISLMFASLKGICISSAYSKENKWMKIEGRDLTGKTVGIIGLGSIGKEVAKKLKSFDVSLLAYDVYYDEPFMSQYNIKKETLENVLINADIITLHLPAFDERPLISYKEFSCMKKDAVLINTARASLIDQQALIKNLEEGNLFAVGLDVHPDEPNFDERLFKFENVILTPHNAAISREAIDKTSVVAVENLIESFQKIKFNNL
ncbi:phosphoglycerate dehydrogenase [Anaerosinus massiliensis]|uniref:phosphoglycerate dehydrogenase n=1 Tax=Massilibacillus massiliensis TaxID=1806837 RepID=UPI000DA63435|nr:phosphoglycerate dehydrogenase [Massilibacillus massiliensis]